MPRTALVPVQLSFNGVTPAFAAANATGHSIVNVNGTMWLEVKNAGAAVCNITIQTPATFKGVAVAEVAVVVPITSGDKIIGPFPADLFNQPGGVVYVDFDQVTSVTCVAFYL